MRRIGWILGFMLSMGFPGAFAMEGGDFAPPVVLLDHQGIEKALDLENESSLLILFEAWNPPASTSTELGRVVEHSMRWAKSKHIGRVMELSEKLENAPSMAQFRQRFFTIPISCSPNGIRSIAVPEPTLSSGEKLWQPSMDCPQKRGNHF